MKNKSSLFYCPLSILCSVVFLAACSFMQQPSPKMKTLIVGLAAEYLGSLVTERSDKVDSLVIWSSLLDQGTSKAMSKEEFFSLLNKFNKLYNKDNHPFLGLSVEDVSVEENYADVTFKNLKYPNQEKIWIKFQWTGINWIVVKDSISGKGKFIETTVKN